MRLAEHFICFLAMSLINQLYKSTNVRFYLSYDIKITSTSHFCRKNVIIIHYVRNIVMDSITFPENL